MLPPGPSTPRVDVQRNQRERLFAAMIGTVERHGYENVTVANLVSLAGVSRSDFYEHFANKQECFLATMAALEQAALERMAAAYRSAGPPEERLRAALETWIGLIVAQPAAARLCLVEHDAVGPAAIDSTDRTFQRDVRLVRRALADDPARAQVPPAVVRGVLGGLRKLVHTRLRRHEEAQLPELLPDLWDWARSYRNPPGRLRQRRGWRGAGEPRFIARDQRERLLVAFAKTVAAKGYPSTRVLDVVSTASVSLSTYYEHFEDKHQGFLAAFEAGVRQQFAAVEAAIQQAPDWPHAIHAGLRAYLAFLAAEPDWAKLGFVEVLAAGPDARERLDHSMELYSGLWQPGFEQAPDARPIYAEAITSAVCAQVHDTIHQHGPERLPELLPSLTFIALAPFIGVKDALAMANA
jgi:AcrR family transcriptional regulator